MLSLAARSSRSRSLPCVRVHVHTTNRTHHREPVRKVCGISLPRKAISAISSALSIFLDVFGKAFLFLMCGFPRSHKAMVLSLGVVPDFEDHRAESSATSPDCAELFRIAVLLVDEVSLIEDPLRFLQTDLVSLFNSTALVPIIAEPRRHITVILSRSPVPLQTWPQEIGLIATAHFSSGRLGWNN
jgi:hypothetical protein